MPESIEVGDHVRIGENSLTWEVLNIYRQFGVRLVDLKSGQTGRRKFEIPLYLLHLHTKGTR